MSKSQILAYFELVLKDLVASGRFRIFPLCEYVGGNCFISLVAKEIQYEVMVRKKIVDSTYMDVKVPSTSKPKFEVHAEANLVPVNGIANLHTPWDKYVVLGSGKTGIDAVLFLMQQNINPDKIVWIMPNDAWFLNRDKIQPSIIAASQMSILKTILR